MKNNWLSWLHHKKVREVILQISLGLGIIFILHQMISNLQTNLAAQNIASGFGFLELESSFEIGETWFGFTSKDSYWLALKVGLMNTLKVAILGITACLGVGLFFGIMRLSEKPLISGAARTYIEIIRNIPLLLQLFFFYTLLSEKLPVIRAAWQLGKLPFYLCNRGIFFPALKWVGSWPTWDLPVKGNFNFQGGGNFSPEFLALWLGLTLYTGGFVAEIVRSGIQAVDKGQWEAAKSLGLRPLQSIRLVIFPQALRVIIPPLTGQMLNLTKNSSLAIAIGYPDFVSVANTTLNQTGQAVECVTLIMVVYLGLSLMTSIFMNWYNSKMAFMD